jgi:hypothetical protein
LNENDKTKVYEIKLGSEIIYHLCLRGGDPKGYGTNDDDTDEEFGDEEEGLANEKEENEPKSISQYDPDFEDQYMIDADRWTGWIHYNGKDMKY